MFIRKKNCWSPLGLTLLEIQDPGDIADVSTAGQALPTNQDLVDNISTECCMK